MPTTDDDTALPDERSQEAAAAADDATGEQGRAGGGTAPGVDPVRRRRLLRALVGLTLGVLVVDQVTKVWAVAALVPGERTALLGDLFGLQLVRNPGAALGIATGMTWVLTVVAVAVVVVVARISRRIGSAAWALALGLLLGGALGNLVDRMVREPGPLEGHVIDFLAYGRLFVGNVADIAIVVAAGLIVLLTARGVHVDGTRDAAAVTSGAEARHAPTADGEPDGEPGGEPGDDAAGTRP